MDSSNNSIIFPESSTEFYGPIFPELSKALDGFKSVTRCFDDMRKNIANFQQTFDKIKKLDSLTFEDFIKRSPNKLSAELGRRGWTYNINIAPSDIPKWLRRIDSEGENVLEELFSDAYIEEMLNLALQDYCTIPESMYIFKSKENYLDGRYFEAAFLLLATIERRICVVSPNKKDRIEDKCRKGMRELSEQGFNKHIGKPMTKALLSLYYVPSFSECSIRLFRTDRRYSFDTGNEPKHLDRNWLMHGRMTREITKSDCIQLINALNTLREIEKDI